MEVNVVEYSKQWKCLGGAKVTVEETIRMKIVGIYKR